MKAEDLATARKIYDRCVQGAIIFLILMTGSCIMFFLNHNYDYFIYLTKRDEYKLAKAQFYGPESGRGSLLYGSRWYIWSVEDGEEYHYVRGKVSHGVFEQENQYIQVYYNTLGNRPHVVRTRPVVDSTLFNYAIAMFILFLNELMRLHKARTQLEFYELSAKIRVVHTEDDELLEEEKK